jgi:hypothetical protein
MSRRLGPLHGRRIAALHAADVAGRVLMPWG